MNASPAPIEPKRPADVARMDIARLRVENGMKLDTVFQRVTEIAATTLRVERVGVWLLINNRHTLRCASLYELSKALHSSGMTLEVSDFPDYFAALEGRKTVSAEVATTDPKTSTLADAYLIPLGITSILDAPIFLDGEVVGVVCHEHIGPEREWTTEDRDFAGSMSDLLSAKIRSAEVEDMKTALHLQLNQIAENRRLESLAQMAAGAAHDFNNVLTIVSNHAELIAMNPTSKGNVLESAQCIITAATHGAKLAAELMAFAQPGPNSARVVRPAEIVKEQLPLLKTAAGNHPIQLQIRSDTGRAFIAPDHLQRLVLNLVMNARDAVTDSSSIEIALDSIDAVDERGKQGRFVLLEVRDQGSGIPDEIVGRIFDPFFSTKPRGKGTGLGLSVVNQIVSHAGGFLRLITAAAKGTTFQVYLPRVSV
jgi:two-component system, cell cycle sensor histidine kinase and response regulator CckA